MADDRKESCFHIIADDRKRSQSRLLHTFRTAEVSKLHALCWQENRSKQYGGRRGGNFAVSKFISYFEIPLALHLAPIQKVAFSIASNNNHIQFLCGGI